MRLPSGDVLLREGPAVLREAIEFLMAQEGQKGK